MCGISTTMIFNSLLSVIVNQQTLHILQSLQCHFHFGLIENTILHSVCSTSSRDFKNVVDGHDQMKLYQ